MHLTGIGLLLICTIQLTGIKEDSFNTTNLVRTKKYTPSEYIKTFRDLAIEEMVFSGIPASITMAQGILESGWGNSLLAMNACNHFGMKNKPEWTGETYTVGGNCYKKYSSDYDSWHDHSLHILSRKWYADLFKLKNTDYKSWAYGLKKAGYAEDPQYAWALITLIERYKLYELDEEANNTW